MFNNGNNYEADNFECWFGEPHTFYLSKPDCVSFFNYKLVWARIQKSIISLFGQYAMANMHLTAPGMVLKILIVR